MTYCHCIDTRILELIKAYIYISLIQYSTELLHSNNKKPGVTCCFIDHGYQTADGGGFTQGLVVQLHLGRWWLLYKLQHKHSYDALYASKVAIPH